MKKKITILFFIKTLFVYHLVAQEIHFSQFYENPLTMNPAQTAWYDGNLRVNCMYRTQWRAVDKQPYQTISLSVEKQLHFYDHTYGFGAQIMRDESGYVGLIQNKCIVSGAFALHVNGHRLSGGVELGLVNKSTDIQKYTYDQQYDMGGDNVFNRDFATGEVDGKQLFHASVNAGVMWKKRLFYNYVAEAGVSLFNINTPYESLYGMELENTKQPLRIAVQMGGTLETGKKIHLRPNILYMRQKKATDFLVGANIDYLYDKNLTLFGGTLFRYGMEKNYDASVWILGATYKRISVSASYDINVSSLRTATHNRGAFEVSLTYLSPTWKSSKVKIPCERI